jgi:hypothetical protein
VCVSRLCVLSERVLCGGTGWDALAISTAVVVCFIVRLRLPLCAGRGRAGSVGDLELDSPSRSARDREAYGLLSSGDAHRPDTVIVRGACGACLQGCVPHSTWI